MFTIKILFNSQRDVSFVMILGTKVTSLMLKCSQTSGWSDGAGAGI